MMRGFRFAIGMVTCVVSSIAVFAAPTSVDEAKPDAGHHVLVLPFSGIDAEGERASKWIGDAIGQTLTADVPLDGPYHVTLGEEAAAKDDRALDAGRNAKAEFVVFGTYQKVDGQLRMLGKILRVDAGSTVGQLKATGAVRDLFSLEDELSEQIIVRLRRATMPATAANAETKPAQPEPRDPGAVDRQDDEDDVFANARRPAPRELGVRAGPRLEEDDWDDNAVDRVALSDVGRGIRTRYLYGYPADYLTAGCYSGYPSYPFYGGFYGYGYGSNYSYRFSFGYPLYSNSYPSPYRFSVRPGRINAWPDRDFTAGHGNTPGGVRMTLRGPVPITSRSEVHPAQPSPRRAPAVRTGGGVRVSTGSPAKGK